LALPTPFIETSPYDVIPIVFIHAGVSPYLPTTFLQAKIASPASPRFLLGTPHSKHLGGLIQHINMAGYRNRATSFAATFVNFSTNAASFELICLERWFILLEWMEAYKYERVIYLDSDIMLYASGNELVGHIDTHFPESGLTVAGISGHSCILQIQALRQFVLFVEQAYTSSQALQLLKERYIFFRKENSAGGISDMTFLTDFRSFHPALVADVSIPPEASAAALDITIDYTRYHEEDQNGLKAITWKEGIPYATLKEPLLGAQKQIRMLTLHFQGASKKYIAAYSTVPKGTLLYWNGLNKAYSMFNKIRQKLTG
jgi:hypothetical protein